MANWKGTPVPNEGYVEKVYFNTNLSTEEVVSIIENCGYDFPNLTTYMFLLSQTQEKAIVIMGENPSYACVIYVGDSYVFAHGMEDMGLVEGWNFDSVSNPYEVGGEVLPTYQEDGETFEMGLFNEQLSSLFSITPFIKSEDKNILMHPRNADGTANKDVNLYPRTKVGNLLASNGNKFTMPNVVYKQGGWQGETVPNSGLCPDIYLNTNLSVDEVKALLDTITYHDMGESLGYFVFLSKYIIGNTNYMVQLDIVKLNNDYGVALIINDGEEDSTELIFSTSIDMGGFVGWNTTFGNIINIGQFNSTLNNIYEELGLSVGDQNDKLSSLFSITPFEESSGGLFETNEDGTPNTDKPIQTGISEKRVNELIDLKITGWLGGES